MLYKSVTTSGGRGRAVALAYGHTGRHPPARGAGSYREPRLRGAKALAPSGAFSFLIIRVPARGAVFVLFSPDEVSLTSLLGALGTSEVRGSPHYLPFRSAAAARTAPRCGPGSSRTGRLCSGGGSTRCVTAHSALHAAHGLAPAWRGRSCRSVCTVHLAHGGRALSGRAPASTRGRPRPASLVSLCGRRCCKDGVARNTNLRAGG